MSNVKYQILKDAIKARAEQSKTVLRANLRAASTEYEANTASCRKKEYGSKTRAVLLTYAYLRNRPYLTVESKSQWEPEHLSFHIIQTVRTLGLREQLSPEDQERLNLESLRAWLRATLEEAVDGQS